MGTPVAERAREQIIIGIDPGTIVMGYAIIAARGRKMRLIAMGVLKLDRYADPYHRLRKIHEGVSQLIARYHPDQLAIEAPFYGKNVQSMLKLGRAQGAAIVAAQLADLPVTESPPSTITKMIGASRQGFVPVDHFSTNPSRNIYLQYPKKIICCTAKKRK